MQGLFKRRRFARHTVISLMLLSILLMTFVMPGAVFAEGLAKNLDFGQTHVKIFAPNTIWAGTNAHVIIKATNDGQQPVDVTGTIKLPADMEKQIELQKDFKPTQTIRVAPGETQYMAFTYIKPKSSMNVGKYDAEFTLKVGNEEKKVPWIMDIREGQRLKANTAGIFYMIMIASFLVLIWWYCYFRFYANKDFRILPSKGQGGHRAWL